MTEREKKRPKGRRRGVFCMLWGLLLLVAAGCLMGFNLWDDARANQTSAALLAQLQKQLQAENSQQTNQSDYLVRHNMDMPKIEVDGEWYIGTVAIPAIGLELPILSDWSEEKLKLAPCRYDGSAYSNNLVLAAHNYQSHFGHIENLLIDDEVIVTDIDGNLFRYGVVSMEIIDGSDSERMQTGDWDLTLFTCTLNGRTRFTVRCESFNESE